jgi:GTP-binding protein Era
VTRSGFVAVAGRPNVGKSTLVNSLVGAKVAVTSNRPQTTRRAIRGILNGTLEGERWQLVLVDLPGVQRPRDLLTDRMQRRVESQLAECDAVLFLLSGAEPIGAGDRFIARSLAATGVPVVAALNKVDLLGKPQVLAALDAVGSLEGEGVTLREIFPISARTGAGIDLLARALVALLPEGPLLYPEDTRSDLPRERMLAELIREKALRRTHDELPHSVEVLVEEVDEREDITKVRALLWVETESQKRIVVGKGGSMIRGIGTAARLDMEEMLGRRVFLDLTVKVRRGWRGDESLLDRIGIDAP